MSDSHPPYPMHLSFCCTGDPQQLHKLRTNMVVAPDDPAVVIDGRYMGRLCRKHLGLDYHTHQLFCLVIEEDEVTDFAEQIDDLVEEYVLINFSLHCSDCGAPHGHAHSGDWIDLPPFLEEITP